MLTNFMLPWFPILLSAAAGARLVGKSRANWFGVVCALFWILVVQTLSIEPMWTDPMMVASLLAGSAAIVGIAHWAGRSASLPSEADRLASETTRAEQSVVEATTEFDDWLERHRNLSDPWPEFDEFLRNLLFRHCGAIHVRPFRILSEGEDMLPLRAMDHVEPDELLSAREGILGHVATSGRTFFSFDKSLGELVMRLAEKSKNPPAWCFAIRHGAKTIGVVSVGQLSDRRPAMMTLRAIEKLIGQFWVMLREVCRSNTASTCDPESGFLTRDSFLGHAQRAASESYEHGEPVAFCMLAIEGLRGLLDAGRWDVLEGIVVEIAANLRDRVRPDDVVGRFDDSRIALLLRRVDSELAALIARQMVERLSHLASLRTAEGVGLTIRAGVSGSGTGRPPVAQLAKRAIGLCHEARRQGVSVSNDLQAPSPVVTEEASP